MAADPPSIEATVAARYAALAPQASNLSCGGALELADLRPGERVVDLGCGRGRDVQRAARLVAPGGRAVGVDGTPAMLEAARAACPPDLAEATFLASDLAAVQLPDGFADAVISNCAINHAPDKGTVYREIYRLLRPGGRFVVSDVVAERELPPEVRNDPAAWAACYGGAIPEADYLAAIRAAGFADLRVLARTDAYPKGGVEVRSMTIAGRRPPLAAEISR